MSPETIISVLALRLFFVLHVRSQMIKTLNKSSSTNCHLYSHLFFLLFLAWHVIITIIIGSNLIRLCGHITFQNIAHIIRIQLSVSRFGSSFVRELGTGNYVWQQGNNVKHYNAPKVDMVNPFLLILYNMSQN